MNNKLKAILISISLIALIGLAAYCYLMYSGSRNLSTEKTDFTVASAALIAEFQNNTDTANKKYLEKAIVVKGIISAVKANEISLGGVINCSLKDPDFTVKVNQSAIIKGRVIGYDDLMGEVKLDQCFIIKN